MADCTDEIDMLRWHPETVCDEEPVEGVGVIAGGGGGEGSPDMWEDCDLCFTS